MSVLHRILFALFLLVPALPAQAGDPIILFDPDNPKMNAAINEALATLDTFLENGVDAQGQSLPGAFLKVAFPVNAAEMDEEIIWVGPFQRDNAESFHGLLANEPNHMDGYNLKEPQPFTRAQIRDWGYWAEDGLGYGNYTTHIVLDGMPAEQADPIRARLAPDPLPPGW